MIFSPSFSFFLLIAIVYGPIMPFLSIPVFVNLFFACKSVKYLTVYCNCSKIEGGAAMFLLAYRWFFATIYATQFIWVIFLGFKFAVIQAATFLLVVPLSTAFVQSKMYTRFLKPATELSLSAARQAEKLQPAQLSSLSGGVEGGDIIEEQGKISAVYVQPNLLLKNWETTPLRYRGGREGPQKKERAQVFLSGESMEEEEGRKSLFGVW